MGISGNTIIYTTMIKAYSKTYQLEKAMDIYEVMRHGPSTMQPNIITYNSLIDCCVRCGDMNAATMIFTHMKSNTDDSKETKEIIRPDFNNNSKVPDLITYSTLIKGHCKARNIEQALILHEQMLQLGIKADEVLYNSLLDGCLKADETDMALKCFTNMKKLKIKPSNVTYSILAKIY